LINVDVTFNGVSDHDKTYDKNFTLWSGKVYQGTLVYYLKNCVTGVVRMIPCDVKTGGYHMSNDLKKPTGMPNTTNFPGVNDDFWTNKPWMTGSDTAWPPGDYDLETAMHTGKLKGFRPNKEGQIPTVVEGKSIVRTLMKMHFLEQKNGSSGCIVFTDSKQWDTFTDWMKKRLNNCPKLESSCPECKAECKDKNYVPLKVDYFRISPVYKLKGCAPGGGDGGGCGGCSANRLLQDVAGTCCDGCGN
jgi:hypothetical protein